jgi:hypothetical protein
MLGSSLGLPPQAVRAVRGATAAASLDLSFLYGVMDPRITFTRSTTATFTGSSGVLQTAAINQHRFDYDPVTLAAKGLLIEEARTNLIIQSSAYSDSSWVKTTSTITSDAATAPDGTLTADRLVEDATAATGHRIGQIGPNPATATPHTFSVYVKAGTRTKAIVELAADSGATVTAWLVDLIAGTVTLYASAGVAGTYTVSNAGAGWWRVSCTITPTTTTNAMVPRVKLHNGTTDTYTGDGASYVLVWGTMLEAGAFPTSYIPTAASTVTRAADVASMPLGSWFNASAGTLFVDYSAAGVASGSFPRIAEMSNGTANERVVINFQSSSTSVIADVTTGGVNQVLIGGVGALTGKTAFAYAVNDFAVCTSGGAVFTDAAGALPSLTVLHIGNRAAGDRPFSGNIRRLKFFASRLPDSTLQSITT